MRYADRNMNLINPFLPENMVGVQNIFRSADVLISGNIQSFAFFLQIFNKTNHSLKESV